MANLVMISILSKDRNYVITSKRPIISDRQTVLKTLREYTNQDETAYSIIADSVRGVTLYTPKAFMKMIESLGYFFYYCIDTHDWRIVTDE